MVDEWNEEVDLVGIGRADAITVAKSNPAARAEANVPQRWVARANRRGAPGRAHSTEHHVVNHVLRQQPLGDDVGNVRREGRPVQPMRPALAGDESGSATLTLQSGVCHSTSEFPPAQKRKRASLSPQSDLETRKNSSIN